MVGSGTTVKIASGSGTAVKSSNSSNSVAVSVNRHLQIPAVTELRSLAQVELQQLNHLKLRQSVQVKVHKDRVLVMEVQRQTEIVM